MQLGKRAVLAKAKRAHVVCPSQPCTIYVMLGIGAPRHRAIVWPSPSAADRRPARAMPEDTTTQDVTAVERTAAAAERQRRVVRENAKRVIRTSGIGEMLRTLNRNALQGRGWFEEYDSGVIFKWGSGYTRRHIWID